MQTLLQIKTSLFSDNGGGRAMKLLVAAALSVVFGVCNAQTPPEWAYPVNPPGFKPRPDDGTPRRMPGSTATFTLTQLRDYFLSPDWHAADHPAQPEVVAHGRKPDVFACGFCHRADGAGGPENANLMGLPAKYIVQQMADFKSGARGTSVRGRNIKDMIALAKAATDAEVQAAATYFSSIKPRAVIRVVEAESIPRTYVTDWHLALLDNGQQEAIRQRIIEVPEVLEQFESRDTHARFIAYVPPGSVKRGEALAATGGGKTVPCAACHGAGLTGTADIPGIAGRSPTYLFRQLYDFKHGARAGVQSALMKPVVENLEQEDMIALAAYAASLALGARTH
jgi:cytochrome c553